MFSRNRMGTKPVSEMNYDQLEIEKKRRIAQLAEFHSKLGRDVEIRQEGIGVELDQQTIYFLIGDDPRMITIHKIVPIEGDIDKLLDVAAAITNAAFAAKVGIGPNGERHAAHFTMEMFMPNLKAFFQVIDVYLSALNYSHLIFDEANAASGA